MVRMQSSESMRARGRELSRLLALRGIQDERVLAAMERVPREAFVEESLAEFAYEDAPLPIGSGQTVSQPFIVALTAEHLGLGPGDTVLEVGTGSGYAAAVLKEVVGPEGKVFTIERFGDLAADAARRLAALGYKNVEVRTGDGTRGWAEHAPYDGIAVAAGGPAVPRALREQLAVGGVLVIPVGETPRDQTLLRVRRLESGYKQEELGAVRFVPLVGHEGWGESVARGNVAPQSIPRLMADRAERLATATDLDVSRLVGRFGDRRVVLLGEATHGTSEFYAMRAEITKALIRQGDCRIVALEADWPDAARIDAYVRGRKDDGHEWRAFSRFPTWMWRNREFRAFVDWLHAHNAKLPEHDRVAVRGLDLYSLYTSADAVIRHLDRIDPQAAAVARQRYGCLSPWEQDPATYGLAASRGSYGDCEEDVVTMLEDLLRRGRTAWSPDGDRFLDMVQNARLVKNAERYYRAMYHGGREAWNVRDSHMYETLMVLLEDVGEDASAVVWAHNSHIGDARATEMARRGEHNIGQLCRQALQSASYLIGFGTHHGTVAAADHWGGEVKVKKVSPSRTDSYERLAHDTRVPVMLLPLHEDAELAEHLAQPRLERAIGVVYRPQTELSSHYFQAVLPEQFDEYAWVDETHAVTPLAAADVGGVPDTYPFGV